MRTVIFVQLTLFWLLLRPLLSFLSHLQIIYRFRWTIKELKGPAILVSNHTSYNDYIFIGALFPFSARQLPLRYLVAEGYMRFINPPLAIILRLAGCIPVGRTHRGKRPLSEVLINAEKALEEEQILIIFPEGKRVKTHRPIRGGRGTAYLAMKHHVPVVPLYIDCNVPSFWRVLLRKNYVKLYVGEPFYLKGNFNNNDMLLKNTGVVLNQISHLAP